MTDEPQEYQVDLALVCSAGASITVLAHSPEEAKERAVDFAKRTFYAGGDFEQTPTDPVDLIDEPVMEAWMGEVDVTEAQPSTVAIGNEIVWRDGPEPEHDSWEPDTASDWVAAFAVRSDADEVVKTGTVSVTACGRNDAMAIAIECVRQNVPEADPRRYPIPVVDITALDEQG